VFAAKSQAEFEWERSMTWNGRPVTVWKYHIAREHSTFNSSASGFLHSSRVVFGVDGTIYADAETNHVLRLSVDAKDLPASYPVKEIHIALEYAKQKIGDTEYLLPAQSISESVMGKERRKSETRFIDYRKFLGALRTGGFHGSIAYEMCSPLLGGGSMENLDRYATRFLEFIHDFRGRAGSVAAD